MSKIKRKCKKTNCFNVATENGYCEKHQQYRKEVIREKEKSFKCRQYAYLYKSKRWLKMRERQLRKQPLCEECLKTGRYEIATVADHIIDHKGNEDLFYNCELQSLCDSCHSKKTNRENQKKTKTRSI